MPQKTFKTKLAIFFFFGNPNQGNVSVNKIKKHYLMCDINYYLECRACHSKSKYLLIRKIVGLVKPVLQAPCRKVKIWFISSPVLFCFNEIMQKATFPHVCMFYKGEIDSKWSKLPKYDAYCKYSMCVT